MICFNNFKGKLIIIPCCLFLLFSCQKIGYWKYSIYKKHQYKLLAKNKLFLSKTIDPIRAKADVFIGYHTYSSWGWNGSEFCYFYQMGIDNKLLYFSHDKKEVLRCKKFDLYNHEIDSIVKFININRIDTVQSTPGNGWLCDDCEEGDFELYNKSNKIFEFHIQSVQIGRDSTHIKSQLILKIMKNIHETVNRK